MQNGLPSGTLWRNVSKFLNNGPAGLRFRPLAMMALQTVWLILFGSICWGWFRSVAWVATTHFPQNSEPDLIGLAIWLIFLSLGFFTLWALVGWIVSVAPVLMLMEECSAGSL